MNILVVDDEKDVQILFEQRFRKEIREGLNTFCICLFRRGSTSIS